MVRTANSLFEITNLHFKTEIGKIKTLKSVSANFCRPKTKIFRNFAGFPINSSNGKIHAILSARELAANRDGH